MLLNRNRAPSPPPDPERTVRLARGHCETHQLVNCDAGSPVFRGFRPVRPGGSWLFAEGSVFGQNQAVLGDLPPARCGCAAQSQSITARAAKQVLAAGVGSARTSPSSCS